MTPQTQTQTFTTRKRNGNGQLLAKRVGVRVYRVLINSRTMCIGSGGGGGPGLPRVPYYDIIIISNIIIDCYKIDR